MKQRVKITVAADCGNSPKNLFLRDFNVATAKGDLAAVKQYLADDVVWHLYEPAGQKIIRGSAAFIDELENNLVIQPKTFIIESAISHGKKGAVNGTIEATDGKTYVFCDLYTIGRKTGKFCVQEVISYIIEKEE